MRVELRVRDEFEAAHSLRDLPPEHKCSRLHGHRYEVEVAVAGEVADGYLIEYETIQAEVATVLGIVDHRCLDDAIRPSTTENLAFWLWQKLKQTKISEILHEVRIQESSKTCCVYRGG